MLHIKCMKKSDTLQFWRHLFNCLHYTFAVLCTNRIKDCTIVTKVDHILSINTRTYINTRKKSQRNTYWQKKTNIHVRPAYSISSYITRRDCLLHSWQSRWINNSSINTWCLHTTECNYRHLLSISGKLHFYLQVRLSSASTHCSFHL